MGVAVRVELQELGERLHADPDGVASTPDRGEGGEVPLSLRAAQILRASVEPGPHRLFAGPGEVGHAERRCQRVALSLEVRAAQGAWDSGPADDEELVVGGHGDHALDVVLAGEAFRLSLCVRERWKRALGDGAHGDQRGAETVLLGDRVAQEKRALAQRRQHAMSGRLADPQPAGELGQREPLPGVRRQEVQNPDRPVGG